MLLRLSMYDITVKYVGAKGVLIADTLSRLTEPGKDAKIPGLDVKIAQVLNIRHTRLAQLQDETKSDSILRKLMEIIQIGWPENRQDLEPELQQYWCFRDQLGIVDGLVMKGERVVIPSSLREENLVKLHEGHQGLSATLQRARRILYWPKMKNDIEEMIQQCDKCQIHGRKKTHEATRQISATKPMETISADLMDFQAQPILVSIDFYSGYILVDTLKSKNANAVTTRMNENFRKFGLVERILTDNGPCFKSENFNNFCKEHEVHHSTSSPHYHQSNGRAERAIQTIRNILDKASNDNEITKALLAYHDTPITADLPSPAELFLNRRINTSLAAMSKAVQLNDEERVKLADKRAAHLKPASKPKDIYFPQQPIWFTEDGNPDWKPGFIDSSDAHPESYWVTNLERTRRLRRNWHDIKFRRPMQNTVAKPECTDVPVADGRQTQSDALPMPEIEVPRRRENAADRPVSAGIPKPNATIPAVVPATEPDTTMPAIVPATEPDTTMPAIVPTTEPRRSNRNKKSTKHTDFVYGVGI